MRSQHATHATHGSLMFAIAPSAGDQLYFFQVATDAEVRMYVGFHSSQKAHLFAQLLAYGFILCVYGLVFRARPGAGE